MKLPAPALLTAAALLLTACQTDDVITLESENTSDAAATQEPVAEERTTLRSADIKPGQAECAIYYAVTGQLLIEKREANGDILAGCPESASIGADISASGSAPSGTKANSLIAKMIDKGVPRDIAGQVSRSQAFREWLSQSG